METIANSSTRDSTLIFVIEDDAQNGADHVDARRSVAFVIGAGVRQHALVSTRYTTVSILRTIEDVLGLAPLGLNDALALPMADVFDPTTTTWTYHAEAADVLRDTKLPIPADRYAVRSALTGCKPHTATYWDAVMKGQDFQTEDHLDTGAFNTALWSGLGSGPQPTARDGHDLRANRAAGSAAVTSGGACQRS